MSDLVRCLAHEAGSTEPCVCQLSSQVFSEPETNPVDPKDLCTCDHEHGLLNMFYGEWSSSNCSDKICDNCRKFRNGVPYSGIDLATGKRRERPSCIYKRRYEAVPGTNMR